MEHIPSTPKTVKNVAKDEPAESGPRVVTVAGQKYEVRVINKKRLMIPIGSLLPFIDGVQSMID